MEQRPSIVNVINFIRGVEPREEMDLVRPVHEQLALLARYEMRGTFLLQYDALLDIRFKELLQDTPHELGGWLEIVQPMAERAGIPWRGRFPWDWHADVGFSVGYTPREREQLVDVFMQLFHETFGRYPRSVGSWMIDAHTLSYLYENYHITASCNCKDQWGTDGYTLWGGYYGQAYYPSRSNAYAPAQCTEQQIPLPVFKMLGSDPVYQYDAGLSLEAGGADWQGVVTLEPVYMEGGGGGNPEWVRWFFEETLTDSCCLSFRYAQAGQENSFGWPAMADGLLDQFMHLDKMLRAGALRVETLEESADWFRETYPLTPNSAITALSDWRGDGRKSVWFCSRRYRANLYVEEAKLWLRDLTLFDDAYRERYLKQRCDNPLMCYDNLPVIDGNRWSGGGVRAGGYFCSGGSPVGIEDLQVSEEGERLTATAKTAGGVIDIRFDTERIDISAQLPEFSLLLRWHGGELENAVVGHTSISLTHKGFAYTVVLVTGSCERVPEGIRLLPSGGVLALGFTNGKRKGICKFSL